MIRATPYKRGFLPGNSESCISSRHHLFQQFITRLVREPRVVLRGGPTCVHESLQVQCIWPGRYHVATITSML